MKLIVSKLIVNRKKERYAKIFSKIEFNDIYRRFYHARTQVFHLVHIINKNLPKNISDTFFETKEEFVTFFDNERHKIDKKMDWLVHKHHEAELKKIRLISYCYNNSFTFPSSHKICIPSIPLILTSM